LSIENQVLTKIFSNIENAAFCGGKSVKTIREMERAEYNWPLQALPEWLTPFCKKRLEEWSGRSAATHSGRDCICRIVKVEQCGNEACGLLSGFG